MHRYRLPDIRLYVITSRVFLLVMCMAGFLMAASSAPAQTSTTSSAPAQTSTSDWLTFRGNPAHTGVSSLAGPSGPTNSIQVKWRWQVNGRRDPISASPLVTQDGTVIVGTEGGYLASLQQGTMSWSMSLGDSILSTPAVDGSGNIFVVTSEGYVYFLTSGGITIWQSDFGVYGSVSSSPVISGNAAYFGADDNALLSINLSPNMSGSGGSLKLPWYIVQNSSFLTAGNVNSSPALDGNNLYFGSGEYLYALSPSSGGGGTGSSTTTTATSGGSTNTTTIVNPVIWWYQADDDVNSSTAVSNGKVYVGADDGYLYAFSEASASTTTPASTTTTSTASAISTVALSPGTGPGWRALSIIATNEPLWKRKTGGKIRSSPAVTPPITSTVSTSANAARTDLCRLG